jgi:hypothetical protein
MSQLDITVKESHSPYQYQGAYKRPVDLNEENDLIISPDIENSYIQQNLPVRRQSLIVYHDKMKNSNEHSMQHKRHSSLILSQKDKQSLNTRLSNSKSFNSITPPALSIQTTTTTTRKTITDENASPTTSNSSSSGGTEFSMDTLYEDQATTTTTTTTPSPRQQMKTPKFIGKNTRYTSKWQ